MTKNETGWRYEFKSICMENIDECGCWSEYEVVDGVCVSCKRPPIGRTQEDAEFDFIEKEKEKSEVEGAIKVLEEVLDIGIYMLDDLTPIYRHDPGYFWVFIEEKLKELKKLQ